MKKSIHLLTTLLSAGLISASLIGSISSTAYIADYFTFRKTSIRNKENGNPHQGTHQFATRNALADGDITE